jgi:hypothetical protein
VSTHSDHDMPSWLRSTAEATAKKAGELYDEAKDLDGSSFAETVAKADQAHADALAISSEWSS